MASAVPVSYSTYSYACTTMGEMAAMGVTACLLLAYDVPMSSTSIGGSGYLNEMLSNVFGSRIPRALTAAPFGDDPGIMNLPATLLITMCAALLIRAPASPRGWTRSW